MKCPNCQHDLKKQSLKGVWVDECDNCSGKWFDRDELRRAKDNVDDNLRWLDFDLFDHKENKYQQSTSQKICPKDSSKMAALTYMDSKIVIDKCDVCQGVFLDNQEFEKIIKYLEKMVVTESADHYGKDVIKEFGEILTGSESKMSEIKDFLSVMNTGLLDRILRLARKKIKILPLKN